MRPRSDFLFVAIVTAIASLVGCSSDDSKVSTSVEVTTAETTAGTTAGTEPTGADETPTSCAAEAAADQPVVTIDVDDDSDGLGRFGLKTPSPLQAGLVRLVVNAVEDNPDPVDVAITSADASVFEFVQVPAGVLCGADVELAAGEYTVTFGAKTKTFTVDPAA